MVVWATGVNLEADDWPQWRGPERSDVSSETGLLRQWPDDGPRREWLFENAGRGYAGFSTAEGTLFTMGTREEQEILLALDAKTGRELWATPIGEVFVEERGDGPRGTPTVNGGNVYAMGSRGDLIAANASDGVALWRVSMLELGGKVPTWGYTESVLVDGERVICTPGGDQGAVVALDKRDGTVLWQSTEFTAPAQYASPIVFEFNGERQYAQLTMESLVGLSPEDGSLLWEKDWSGRTAVISTPIYHDGHIYVSSAYGAGCMLVRLKPNHEVEEVYANKVMKNHHGGVLRIDGYLYGYSDGAGFAIRQGKFKMVYSGFKGDFFLFDLEKDPYEHTNLAKVYPEKLEALKKTHAAWNSEMMHSRWSDPHAENISKEEGARQVFIDKAMAGQKSK